MNLKSLFGKNKSESATPKIEAKEMVRTFNYQQEPESPMLLPEVMGSFGMVLGGGMAALGGGTVAVAGNPVGGEIAVTGGAIAAVGAGVLTAAEVGDAVLEYRKNAQEKSKEKDLTFSQRRAQKYENSKDVIDSITPKETKQEVKKKEADTELKLAR